MPNSVERPTRVPMIFRNCVDVDALLDVVGQVEVRVVELVGGASGPARRCGAASDGRQQRDDSHDAASATER